MPQKTFIHLIALLNLLLYSDTNVASKLNHVNDAIQTPKIKNFDISTGSEARNPPSNNEPSMIACGLSHVTEKQDIIIFIIESSVFLFSEICEDERINPVPI